MRFWKSAPGAVILILIVAGLVGLGTVAVQVYRVTHPPRQAEAPLTLTSAVVPVEEVRFDAPDGVSLDGWVLKGDPSMPFIVLCHGLGRSKGSLLDLAVRLQKDGFNLLLFDFRGHGGSDGGGSSLGLDEKRDVIGAVDFLESLDDVDAAGFGVFGVGMGAHAAVLAAVDRPGIRVLVLDGLYPGPTFPLAREVYGDWSFGVRHLSFIPAVAFRAMHAGSSGTDRAAAQMSRLAGRNILLLAPAGDSSLATEMQAMYEAIPEHQDAEGNLVLLPSAQRQTLYGEELALYQNRVASFFESRLAVR